MTTPHKTAPRGAAAGATSPLSPLLAAGQPVEWWFAFKFNDQAYPGDETKEPNPGFFGGSPDRYKDGFCLSYACASSANPSLQMGVGSIGASVNDPLGATFNQIYRGTCNYVLWNDQFYGSPIPSQDSPWGHAKGVLAWDNTGSGFVIQVSTPSWPASGSAQHPRANDGNTLGCIQDDDVLVSQHFFALKLTPADVAIVLAGLANASVVTKPGVPQLFNAGGPANLQGLANKLGVQSNNTTVTKQVLSSGVTFISKPSALHVPVWQMVSAQLGGVPLRAATWWAAPEINSTTATSQIGCWSPALGAAGAVQIAISGSWQGKTIGLQGEDTGAGNHAKVGVLTDPQKTLCIFGDMNQQGTLNALGQEGCASSQNGRGGTFYVLNNAPLFASLTALLQGAAAPVK